MEAHIATAGAISTPCRHSTTALQGHKISEIVPVNAPARLDSAPRLEDFPYRLTDNVRFADLDPNQHVNNAVYATYFETGRVTLMKDPSYALTPVGLAWILVRLDIHFRAELRWPGVIEMGIGVSKFGRTSVTFDQVVFSEGRCVASAQSVTVLIGEASRKPTQLTSEIIAKFQPWLRRVARHAG
jgi:acyl-CoA thioester hydrolase